VPAHSGAHAQVYASGTPVVHNGQNLADIDSGAYLKYQITTAAHQVLDPKAAITVYKNGVIQSPALYTLNRLYGTVTFASALLNTDVVSADITYLPMTAVAGANSAEGSFSRAALDMTTFASQGNTERVGGLGDASGTVGRFYQADQLFVNAVDAGSVLVVAYWSNTANAAPDWRVWALFNKADIKADPASLIGETAGWVGTTDADGRQVSFGA
jgi:hypothetical protein